MRCVGEMIADTPQLAAAAGSSLIPLVREPGQDHLKSAERFQRKERENEGRRNALRPNGPPHPQGAAPMRGRERPFRRYNAPFAASTERKTRKVGQRFGGGGSSCGDGPPAPQVAPP